MENIDNFGLSLTNRNQLKRIGLGNMDFIEIFDSGIFDSVPYLGEIITTYKGFMNLRDKIFTKKFIKFLQAFESQDIDETKREEFRNKIQDDKKYRIKVTETLIEYIDDFKNENKIIIYSNLFSAYINGSFNWEYFLQLSDCLEKVDIPNLSVIPKIDTTEGKEVQQYNEEETTAESNLESSGLAIRMSVWSSDIYPTRFGKDLYKYGLKNTTANHV
ncbi:hypothetical protein [Pontibacter harenae]|uniref:hypothetical protein n=1 Tax=Pontibacter harenae TaxID=2894083 RepID=UPI001E560C57|nr:hypothetical protein [Pontibacter harenae]MCC9166539.1 hypothetical protein [Pontibacter harenae]